MKTRIRVILLIIATNFSIIIFSVSAGIGYVRANIERYMETDMLVVADIADEFISNQLEMMRMMADNVVAALADSGDKMNGVLEKEEQKYRDSFIGMSVINGDAEIIAFAGELSVMDNREVISDILDDVYVRRAFSGEKTFTSTVRDERAEHKLVFYLAAPVPENDAVLLLTIDGMFFRELTVDYYIWETGHIFIDDAEGTVIANRREDWVQSRRNFIAEAQTEEGAEYKDVAQTVQLALDGEKGIGYYNINGEDRICAYRPISGSYEGWVLGIVAPLTESPIRNVDQGLLLIGVIAFFLNVIAAVVASRFITKPFEQVAVLKEEAEAHSRYKSNFLANVSNELRTPLNTIIGLTDLMLEEEGLPQNIKANHISISNSGDALLSIVNDMMDISNMEMGKIVISDEDYHVPGLLSDTAVLIKSYIGEKPIDFKLNIDENLPVMLRGDGLRVKQIMTNLLSNAVKYTRFGTVELRVSSKRDNGCFWLDIAVKDTGMGIKPEGMSGLFNDYFRCDQDANHKIEGTGLGLSITRQLANLMQGTISAESEYGKGSEFTARIRQGYVDDDVIGAKAARNLGDFKYSDELPVSHKSAYANLCKARALVVDDVQSNLDIAAGLMSKYKIKVDCVLSGREAVTIISAGEPLYDAVFMDHMMPGMDGIEAAAAIRALGTKYARDIPIIALTANAVAGTSQMFIDNGFQAFLPKPIDIMLLDSVLKKWVRDRGANKGDSLDI